MEPKDKGTGAAVNSWWSSLRARVLVSVLACLFLAATAVIAFIAYGQSHEFQNNVLLEIVKTFLQLVVVILIGAIVTALFKNLQSDREDKAKERDRLAQEARLRAQVQEEYARQVGLQYRLVKSYRRSLRVAGLTTKHSLEVNLTPYQISVLDEEMKKINAAQLELEGMRIEASGLSVFAEIKTELENPLRTMERYLRSLLREYEKWMPQLRAGVNVQFDQFNRLRGFTGSTEGEGEEFRTSFADPYAEIVHLIGDSILGVNKPTSAGRPVSDATSTPPPAD